MKNILIINSLYYPDIKGGAEYSIKNLAEGLNKKYNVYVLCLSKDTETIDEVIEGIHVKRIPIKNLYNPFYGSKGAIKPLWHLVDSYNPFYKQAVTSYIEGKKIDLAITNNIVGFSPAVWSVLKSRNIPLIHILRDYNLLCPKSLYDDGPCEKICAKCRLFYLAKKGQTEEVDTVVGISTFILNKHQEYGLFKESDQKTIPNSINLSLFGDNKNGFIKYDFGFIGRLTKSKGIFDLIDVFENTDVSHSLGIAGDTSNFQTSRYSEINNISFLGYVDKVNFFSQVQFTIVPSNWYEPFGRVVVESYAAGRPVIARKSGGLSELVNEGETGFLYDSKEELRDLISYSQNLSEEKYNDLQRNCLAQSKQFSSKRVTKEYFNLLDGFDES